MTTSESTGAACRNLTTVLAHRACTADLRSGRAGIPGATLLFEDVEPMIHAYRLMIRTRRFDICELAPVAYLAAREAGVPLTALPVFVARHFHHGDIVCRAGSGITEPEHLIGRRIGVRAYTVSTSVWVRGILDSEYGVSPDSVTWLVDDEDHILVRPLPPNVEHVDEGDSVAAQFARGEIDVALTGAAGIGRTGAPSPHWSGERRRATDAYPLFPDADDAARDWFRRTGIYPIHALIAIRAHVAADLPALAGDLTDAFETAKQPLLEALATGAGDTQELRDHAHVAQMVDGDPLPFGLDANRASLEALVDFSYEQGILSRRPALTELFAVA